MSTSSHNPIDFNDSARSGCVEDILWCALAGTGDRCWWVLCALMTVMWHGMQMLATRLAIRIWDWVEGHMIELMLATYTGLYYRPIERISGFRMFLLSIVLVEVFGYVPYRHVILVVVTCVLYCHGSYRPRNPTVDNVDTDEVDTDEVKPDVITGVAYGMCRNALSDLLKQHVGVYSFFAALDKMVKILRLSISKSQKMATAEIDVYDHKLKQSIKSEKDINAAIAKVKELIKSLPAKVMHYSICATQHRVAGFGSKTTFPLEYAELDTTVDYRLRLYSTLMIIKLLMSALWPVLVEILEDKKKETNEGMYCVKARSATLLLCVNRIAETIQPKFTAIHNELLALVEKTIALQFDGSTTKSSKEYLVMCPVIEMSTKRAIELLEKALTAWDSATDTATDTSPDDDGTWLPIDYLDSLRDWRIIKTSEEYKVAKQKSKVPKVVSIRPRKPRIGPFMINGRVLPPLTWRQWMWAWAEHLCIEACKKSLMLLFYLPCVALLTWFAVEMVLFVNLRVPVFSFGHGIP